MKPTPKSMGGFRKFIWSAFSTGEGTLLACAKTIPHRILIFACHRVELRLHHSYSLFHSHFTSQSRNSGLSLRSNIFFFNTYDPPVKCSGITFQNVSQKTIHGPFAWCLQGKIFRIDWKDMRNKLSIGASATVYPIYIPVRNRTSFAESVFAVILLPGRFANAFSNL